MRGSDVASLVEFRSLRGDSVMDRRTNGLTEMDGRRTHRWTLRKNNAALAHPYHVGSDVANW